MRRLLEEERRHVPFLFVFSLLLYLAFLGGRDLWAPVEPRYGEIARVMFGRGEWIVPTVNGHFYTDKPILYFWSVLGFSHLFGAVNEWTVRLPSALSAVGLVIVTYRLGKRFFDPMVGLVAALVLATTVRVVWEARWAHTDMLFTFFFTCSVFLLMRAWHDGEGEVLWSYVCMGLATLTKGMIGFVLPGLIFLTLLVLKGSRERLRRLRLFTGVGVFLLVTVPWLVAVSLQTQGEWLSEFFWTHHVQRYLSGLGHRKPVYYYLTNFPVDFLPWTPFLIVAAMDYRGRKGAPLRPVPFSLATWFVAVFLFFSISDTKRGLYLLPLYPPAALWIAWTLVGTEREGGAHRRSLTVIAGLLLGALGLAAAAAPVVAVWAQPDMLLGSVVLALVIAPGSILAYQAFRKNLCGSGSVWLALAMLGGILCNGLWIFPAINQYKSPRLMAAEVRRRVSPRDALYIYADRMNTFNFYLEREVIPVLSGPEALARLASEPTRPHLMIRERNLGALGDRRSQWELRAEGMVGSKKWKLFRLGGA